MNFTQEQTNDFVSQMIKTDNKMSLSAFLTTFSDKFYPDTNFDFMEQFLEWSKAENKNKFLIPHEMLYDYGITIDAQSQSAKKRIIALDLMEAKDYQLRKLSEPVKQGGFTKKNQYTFTPRAFKLMLMSASKHKNHKVDVSIYRKYYLFLEEAIAYYKQFQFEVSDRERKFNEQKFKFANSRLYNSHCKIDQLEKTIKEQDRKRDEQAAAHHKELNDTLKSFREEAARQRAEILNETKAAREDISDLHGTVLNQHEELLNRARHASVEVIPSKSQYFAMTSYRLIGDESGTLYFRNWRCQAGAMFKNLIKSMTTETTDKDGNKFTAHHLVIPPIYFPGSVNVGNAGANKMGRFVKNVLDNLNKHRKRGTKITLGDFKNDLGVVTSSVSPVWKPNDHLTHGQFVDFFLDEIKQTKVVKMSVSEPKLQEELDKQASKQYRELINATGAARENLMDIIDRVRMEMETPPSSDEE